MSTSNTTNAALTYAKAGVNIEAADHFLARVLPLIQRTHAMGDVVPSGNQYAGLIRPELSHFASPLIAATCDGVGTKLLVARMMDDYRGLGQALVAMNVNDLLPQGATPLLFLDYIATGSIREHVLETLVRGMSAACLESRCVLLAGETAEMPGVYQTDEFYLAGFAVGLVDAAKVPKSDSLAPGDVLLALPSSGLHASGFSLARKALLERGNYKLHENIAELQTTLGQALLVPTALYVNAVLDLMQRVHVKAGAHITGGGLLGRLQKLTPAHVNLSLELTSFKKSILFDMIQEAGDITRLDMNKTFNMGIGYVAVVSEQEAHQASPTWLRIGTVTQGDGTVSLGY